MEDECGKRKKSKYPKKAGGGRKKLKPLGGLTPSTSQFAATVAPPDKKFLRQEAKRQRKAAAEASRAQQAEEEAKMLADLQQESRLQRLGGLAVRCARVMCCCCCWGDSKHRGPAEKFAMKSDAEVESEKKLQWLSDKTDAVMVETMFKVRSLERESKRRYQAVSRWFGGEGGREMEQSADILRASCLNGEQRVRAEGECEAVPTTHEKTAPE